jgi:hypothetical protein
MTETRREMSAGRNISDAFVFSCPFIVIIKKQKACVILY